MAPANKENPDAVLPPRIRLCPIYLHCHRRLICAISDDTSTIVSQSESIAEASDSQTPFSSPAVCESLQPSHNPIRLLLVARPTLFRAALRMLLESHPGINVIGETDDRASALALAAREQPEVILFEQLRLLNNSFDFLTELCGDSQKTRVIIFVHEPDNTSPEQLIRLGVSGLLGEETTPLVLFKAIDKVYAGEVWFERRTLAKALSRRPPDSGTDVRDIESRIGSLTDREREVIALVGEGLKNKQIADRLFISDTTVHHHLSSVYAKLGVSDRLELVIYAYRQGLVKLPSS